MIDRDIKKKDVIAIFLFTNDRRSKGNKKNNNNQHINEHNRNNNSNNFSNVSVTSSQSDDEIFKSKTNKYSAKSLSSYLLDPKIKIRILMINIATKIIIKNNNRKSSYESVISTQSEVNTNCPMSL